MPITDAAFLLPETREQPMHVGGLQIFELPEDAGPDYLPELYRRSIGISEVSPLFRKRPYRSLLTGGQWTWIEDEDIDLEHHIRHSALPRPGRVRELLVLASRLHGTPLDRKRPLWEAHLIEGLEGDRFAIYTKLHHALMDGVSGLRLLQRSLSTDPDERDRALPWEAAPRPRKERSSGPGLLSLPGTVTKLALQTTGEALGMAPRVLRLAEHGLREQATVLPGQAPKSMFNVSITGSRRFAGESWPMDRIRAVAKGAGATVNDVVLAMCSGALRRYLQERDALPAASLVAMTPVSLRSDDDDEPGNAVGTILCQLGTQLADPAARLHAVKASMDAGKAGLKGLSTLQITALSTVVMAPLALNSVLALHKVGPPPFNLIISNVPGPAEPLYWNGARLQGMYPLSIPLDGQALNITVTSYAGCLQFGLTGCRRTVPQLQRMLAHLETSLAELEEAFAPATVAG